MNQKSMTFDQFKAELIDKFGKVQFNEHGKHGWTSVDDILNKKAGGAPGPHWCDAAPIPRTQCLLGTYDFNKGIATFY